MVKKGIKKLGKILLWSFWELSGAHHLFRKIRPLSPEQENIVKAPVTAGLWIVGIYVALFGLVSQRYQSKISIIENRINSVISSLSTPGFQQGISRIPKIQKMLCPIEPELLSLRKTILSLFGVKDIYEEGVILLKQTIENWKYTLSGVYMPEVDLQGAHLDSANLGEAWIMSAHLENAYLIDATLTGACLDGANLSNAHLSRANLSNASLLAVNLTKANLIGANFSRANMSKANLDRTLLNRADFSGANLIGAHLNNTDLSNVKTFNMAKLDLNVLSEIKTKWPEKLATTWDDKKKDFIIDSVLLDQIKRPNWAGWTDSVDSNRSSN